jgi:hypothetical protein
MSEHWCKPKQFGLLHTHSATAKGEGNHCFRRSRSTRHPARWPHRAGRRCSQPGPCLPSRDRRSERRQCQSQRTPDRNHHSGQVACPTSLASAQNPSCHGYEHAPSGLESRRVGLHSRLGSLPVSSGHDVGPYGFVNRDVRTAVGNRSSEEGANAAGTAVADSLQFFADTGIGAAGPWGPDVMPNPVMGKFLNPRVNAGEPSFAV